MNTITAEQVAALAAVAMERIAFVLSDPSEFEPAMLRQCTVAATIGYTGLGNGHLTLRASEGMVRVLAAGLLGTEPGDVDPATQGVDALKELCNIVAGSVIAELGGTETAFQLGLPEGADRPAGWGGGVVCALSCEGEPLCVCWEREAGSMAA